MFLEKEVDVLIALLQPAPNFKRLCLKLAKRARGEALEIIRECIGKPSKLWTYVDRYFAALEIKGDGMLIAGNTAHPIILHDVDDTPEREISRLCALAAGKSLTCIVILFKPKFSGQARTWAVKNHDQSIEAQI